jgi:hypothetical protein
MGIDASTNSMAFCIMRGKKVIRYGEVMFRGSNVYERILDASLKLRELRSEFKVDYIAIESAVLVNSAAVGIKMAYVFGAIMAELLREGATVIEVKPLTWQSYIGNKSWTPKERAALRAAIPGKSASWYKAEIRKRRKQKTMDYFNKKFKLNIESDNVSDAFGVAHYLSEHLDAI